MSKHIKPKPLLTTKSRTSFKWVLFGGLVATVGGLGLSPAAAIPGAILITISVMTLALDYVRRRAVSSSKVGNPKPAPPSPL